MPISTEDILANVPEDAGSYAEGASAAGQPIGENAIGDPGLNGEHLLASVGLKKFLDGKIHDDVGRAMMKAEEPMLASNEGLSHVEKTVGKHVSKIRDSVQGLYTSDVPKPDNEIKSPEDHKDFTTDLHELANNPQAMFDKLSSSSQYLHAIAPQTAASLQETATRAVQFLASKTQNPPPDPFGNEHEPSQQESSQFQRYLQIVENPSLALKQAKDGTLLPEATETLQTVYPKLYEHMKQVVLSELKPDTSYRTKMSLSQFLGEPLDPSLMSNNIAAIQAIFGSQSPQPAPTSKKAPKSAEKVDLAQRTSLEPQEK